MPPRLSLSLALALALSACAGQDAPAATATAPAATAAASTDEFELDMARVDRFLAATRQLAAAERADSTLDSAMNASTEDTAAYIARLESTPALREAITRGGMTTREYAQTSEALVATLMALGAQEAGLLKDPPAELAPRHLDFVRAHRAELERKLQATDAAEG